MGEGKKKACKLKLADVMHVLHHPPPRAANGDAYMSRVSVHNTSPADERRTASIEHRET